MTETRSDEQKILKSVEETLGFTLQADTKLLRRPPLRSRSAIR